MAKKKKTLPKDFQELVDAKDMKALKKVFDTCEIDARGGYSKHTALSFYNVKDEFVRWMVENGADLEAVDTYKRTALHEHASRRNGSIAVFLELGANIHAVDTYGTTPLHFAAGYGLNKDAVKRLIEVGANIHALDSYKETPLKCALRRASNIDLPALVEITKLLLPFTKEITLGLKDDVTRIGERFEFHRENFNEEFIEESDKALTALYELFDVTPVKRRIMHDGVSKIEVAGTTWEEQFEELWDYLIPSKGKAKTVQGEVVRIAGKVRDEIYRNGGGNWDADFKKMLDAFLVYVSSSNALSQKELADITALVKEIRRSGDGETRELNYLCESANNWVLKNSNPIKLGEVKYKR
ncbi:ankyrin repeat domain-containing protein [Myroides odoratimimus]|uniref:ankyrin repeat domain-containing protein n=1 Tax=Myroides odoratimimus TaxID=76832 RepID=UPI00257754B9|nr:ankyrin repeat domain-containing protein [Myroides odoratimimus]MDM1415266.1 ankyrin repeat domain-containing protein [Myroides odoratimimus]MDM1448143.1 ankyrin repeat domain-containing protein [Myroides odoratimimus]MEC4008102.1 ankyrin repeat domain-containing protein [Myroides odoratimimus]